VIRGLEKAKEITHTMAMHLARPTNISPSRKSLRSGRNALDKASGNVSQSLLNLGAFGTYHEEGCHNPVHHDAEADLYPQSTVLEKMMQALIACLAKDGVHHDEQFDG